MINEAMRGFQEENEISQVDHTHIHILKSRDCIYRINCDHARAPSSSNFIRRMVKQISARACSAYLLISMQFHLPI